MPASPKDPYQTIISASQKNLMRLFCLVALFFFTVQPAILYLIKSEDPSFLYNILGVITSVLILALLRTQIPVKFFKHPMLIIAMCFIFYIAYFDPKAVSDGNLVYLIVLPPLGFFFLGSLGGSVYSLLTIIAISILSFGSFPIGIVSYASMHIYQLISALIFEVLLLYYFQNNTDKVSSLIRDDDQKVREANLRLTEQSTVIIARDEELAKQKNHLERINAIMTGRELAMINLKKKITELESRLASLPSNS